MYVLRQYVTDDIDKATTVPLFTKQSRHVEALVGLLR